MAWGRSRTSPRSLVQVRFTQRPSWWSCFSFVGPPPAIGLITLLSFCRPASFHWSSKNRKQNVALARISLGVLISGKVVLSSLHMYLATIILTVYHNYKSIKHSEDMRLLCLTGKYEYHYVLQNKDDRSNEKLSVKIVFLLTLLGCLLPLSWSQKEDFLRSVILKSSFSCLFICKFSSRAPWPQVLLPLLYAIFVWLLPCCSFVMGVKKVTTRFGIFFNIF